MPNAAQSSTINKIPPFNLDAERAVLGSCLIDKNAMSLAAELLVPDDFYDPRHARAFKTMLEMFNKEASAVDELTFMNEISNRGIDLGGQSFIAAITSAVTTTANIEAHINIVRDKATLRGLINVGTDITKLGFDESSSASVALEQAEQKVYELARTGRTANLKRATEVIRTTFADLESRLANGTSMTGIPSGYSDLDKITGGLQPGSLYILAARPSMGKTALALNIASHVVLEEQVPAVIFSLEMSQNQVAERLITAESEVNIRQMIYSGQSVKDEWERIADAANRLEKAPLFIDETSGLTTLELRAKCRRFFAKQKAEKGLIVVDYLQLMDSSRQTESRQQDVSEISRALKAIAREFKVPVLALSQLSRAVESRQDKRPMLSDLRESGAIEQDADLVMFIYRGAYYKQEAADADQSAEIMIAKNRNGATGKVDFLFLSECTKFKQLLRQF